MNIVSVYHPEDGSFDVYGHDLDESQAKMLVKKLRARGVGSEIIPQAKQHRVELETCGFCQAEVEAFYQKQRQKELLSRPPAQPLSLGQAAISSKIDAQNLIDYSSGAWPKLKQASPYIAGILLLVLVLVLGANPIAQKVAPALQALLQPGPRVTESSSLLKTTTGFVLLAKTTITPVNTQPISGSETAIPVPLKTSTPLPYRTATLAPSATPLPPSATPSPAPSATIASSCRPFADLNLADVGKEACITGTVARTSDKEGIYYIFFDDQTTSFYLVSYEGAGNKIQVGDCLEVTGPVQQVGARPVIVLTWAMEIHTCQ